MRRVSVFAAWLVVCSLLGTAATAGDDPAFAAAAPAEQATDGPADATHAAEAGTGEHAVDDHAGDHGPKLGALLPRAAVAPFAILLLCIAILPLARPHWWEHNRNKALVAAVLAVPTAAYLRSFGASGRHALEHAAQEYASFILLLGSLFVISGGVYVRGKLNGTPALNAGFLVLGSLIASFVGTTGASMLLIRPLLRANETRPRVAHLVVFFIFTVSNCGGLLTPLGDPPLFIGLLKGVPFDWTFRLYPQWLLVNGLLIAACYVWDLAVYKADQKLQDVEPPLTPDTGETFAIQGLHNFLFLGAIVAIIYASGQGLGNGGQLWPWGVQELLMFGTGAAAYCLTPGVLRERNRFTFGPIIEVAVLFAGIFVTMIPALAILNVEGKHLGITEPWQFFWAAGVLSSFLDNAPTYLAFAVTACGVAGVEDTGRYLAAYLATPPATNAAQILAAISCGAVFMGANTYIGNGPNFMVKAIAEENNVRMPSFFGYMGYSLGVLIPIFVVVTIVFFR